VYSNAGDGSIAKYLAMGGAAPGFNSISVGTGRILKILVGIWPFVNWWTVFSIFMMFSSMFFITLAVQVLFDGKRGLIPALMTGVLIWEIAPAVEINFTQTAILSGITGISLVLILPFIKRTGGKVFLAAAGILYLLTAGGLRTDAMLLCIPFAAVAVVSQFVWGRKKKTLLPAVLIAAAVLSSLGLRFAWRAADSDVALFEDTFDLTREVYDYQDMYPEYEKMQQSLEDAGLTHSWYSMLCSYYIADTSHFNPDTMKVPVQFKGESRKSFAGFISDVLQYKRALAVAIGVLLSIFVLLSMQAAWLPALSAVAVFLASGLYFVHIGRYAWRVSGGVILACVVMALFMTRTRYEERDERLMSQAAAFRFRGAFLCFLAFALITAGYGIIKDKTFSFPEAAVTDEKKAAMLDHINESPKAYFTEDMYYSCHNVWSVPDSDYLCNKFSISAGYNLGRKKDLARFGINDMKDFVMHMITSGDILTVYDVTWISYLCDYYNPYVSAAVMDTYDGSDYIQYSAPVETTVDHYDDTVSGEEMYVDSSKEAYDYQTIVLTADIKAEEASEYFLNVEDSSTGAVYSYPLSSDGGRLCGRMLWRNDTWQPAGTGMYIVKRSEGNAVRIRDLTGIAIGYK
jgi:hypothetical protein